jgi:tetratricopeptide (TPR) repeat protein
MLDQLVPVLAQMEQAEASTSLAILDFQLGNIIGLFDAAFQLPSMPFENLCNLLKQLNKYLITRGLYQEQLSWSQALLSYFLAHKEDTADKIDLSVLNTIALGFDVMGHHSEALHIYNFIIDLYADDPFHPALAVICYNASVAYHNAENSEPALQLCYRAIAIDEQHNNQRGLAATLLHLCDLLAGRGDVEGLFNTLERVNPIILGVDDRFLQARFVAKLAMYIARFYDWEQAVSLFERAISMWRALGDEEQLAIVLFNHAILLHETGNTAKAIQQAQQSLEFFDTRGLFYAATVRTALNEWQSSLPDTT